MLLGRTAQAVNCVFPIYHPAAFACPLAEQLPAYELVIDRNKPKLEETDGQRPTDSYAPPSNIP
ncbi:MAG: hypothetical protein WBY44_34540 [Bryobacteraceae bacterium]|jgi:hypothetical protein